MENEEISSLIEEGNDALAFDYKKAWELFSSAYEMKKAFFRKQRVSINSVKDLEFGEIAYQMANALGKGKDDKEFLKEALNIEEDERIEKSRKEHGRKYLKLSADNGYEPAIIDYTYNCIGYNPNNNDYSFDVNERNGTTALYWGSSIIQKNDNIHLHEYCIQAILTWDKYKDTKESEDLNNFYEYVTKFVDENLDDLFRKEYLEYTLACFHLSPEIKKIDEGKYFDVKKSYKLFKKILDDNDDNLDSNILRAVKRNVNLLETKFTSLIKD